MVAAGQGPGRAATTGSRRGQEDFPGTVVHVYQAISLGQSEAESRGAASGPCPPSEIGTREGHLGRAGRALPRAWTARARFPRPHGPAGEHSAAAGEAVKARACTSGLAQPGRACERPRPEWHGAVAPDRLQAALGPGSRRQPCSGRRSYRPGKAEVSFPGWPTAGGRSCRPGNESSTWTLAARTSCAVASPQGC